MENTEKRDPIVIGGTRTPELAKLLLTHWSPNDSSIIYPKLRIFDSANTIKMKVEDILDIGSLLKSRKKVSYKIQEFSNRKEDCNIEGKPAIVVTFVDGKDNITMDVMHGHSGKPFDKDDIFHRYELLCKREMFEKYYDVLSNNSRVEEDLKRLSQNKKVLEF
ncbi:MAG: hypothetical protein U9O86_04990 [Campylobacterota bacterium]|nr:hypothetical protein [Campylobacterota bacterium]